MCPNSHNVLCYQGGRDPLTHIYTHTQTSNPCPYFPQRLCQCHSQALALKFPHVPNFLKNPFDFWSKLLLLTLSRHISIELCSICPYFNIVSISHASPAHFLTQIVQKTKRKRLSSLKNKKNPTYTVPPLRMAPGCQLSAELGFCLKDL